MTRKETINKLDELIAYLNSCRGRDIDRFTLEQKILSSLKNFPISASTLSAIRNVRSAINIPNEMFHHLSIEGFTREHDKRSIVEMTNILNREKDAQNQAMQDEMQKVALEEQRKGNQIQKYALYVSIFAIIISLVSLVVSICKID